MPFLISIIGFLVPQNIGLATKMVILGHLEAEILRNSQFTVAITGFRENGNMYFLISYSMEFVKMYSLPNLQKK